MNVEKSTSNLKIKIDPGYASLVSPPSPEENSSLRQSIKDNGLYVPIIVNQDGIILDGHHRYKACQDLGIEPKTLVREFKDKLNEQLFVIESNLTRRQLSDFQRVELALRLKPLLEEIAKRNESLGGRGVKILSPLRRVDEKIAERAGVSHETVRKVSKILNDSEIITEENKEDLRLGRVSINVAYKVVVREQERRILYEKCLKALEELKESEQMTEDNGLEQETENLQDKEKFWEELARPYSTYLAKVYAARLEYEKAVAAYYFWLEYKTNETTDVESAANQTLKELVKRGIKNRCSFPGKLLQKYCFTLQPRTR